MSLELLNDYVAAKDYERMEANIQPFERDADLSAHVQSVLDSTISATEADYAIMEQNFISLFATLPDLPKIIPESVGTNKATWKLPGTVTYAGTPFDVTYKVTAELPDEGPDLTYEQMCIDEILATIRGARLERRPDSSCRDMSPAELESHERSMVPRYLQTAITELSKRIRFSRLDSDTKTRTKESYGKLIKLHANGDQDITATDLLNALTPYFSEASIMLLIGVGDKQLINPRDRIDSLVGLAKIDELREQRDRNLEMLRNNASHMTISAAIKDGEKTVGTVNAVFGSNDPYLEKLRNLQNNSTGIRYLIESIRKDAFWNMQSTLAAGGVPDATPEAVDRAKRIVAHEETISIEDMAIEVDGYDNQYLQEFAMKSIDEFMGKIAEDIKTLPRDNDTDAISGQQEMLNYLHATDFGAHKPAGQRAWQGEQVRLFGQDIPV